MIDFGELEPLVGGTMSMDRVHCHWLLEVLRALEPRTVIEIGCFAGVSTTAIVKAYDEGAVDQVHLVDIAIQPTVRALARPGVVYHEMPSVDALPGIKPAGDLLVLVDGDHSLACVSQELPLILEKRPAVIVAHDVTAEAAGYGECDGARWLWEELQRLGWWCHVDCRRRPGAATHRGLLVAVADKANDGPKVMDAWLATCCH